MKRLLQIEALRLGSAPRLWALLAALAAVCAMCSGQNVQSTGAVAQDQALLLSAQIFTPLIGTLLAAYVYGADFQSRSFYVAVYHGFPRWAIFVAKLLVFLLLGILLSLLAVIGSAWLAGVKVPSAGMLVRRIVLDLKAWGILALMANLLRRPVPIVALGAAYGFWRMIQPATDLQVWLSTQWSGELWRAVCVFAVCAAASLVLFLRAELR